MNNINKKIEIIRFLAKTRNNGVYCERGNTKNKFNILKLCNYIWQKSTPLHKNKK